ncbi:MACPF domain-containing protein NSL1-like [Euphorbia lathyris]|uniref:MACPF domain-containing protein NSL1-like n=1 Tax=Euphorbia lathyris TaxID=212925 RepID=UPI0033132C33
MGLPNSRRERQRKKKRKPEQQEVELDSNLTRDLVFLGGIVVRDVCSGIKSHKGERTWFRSDVLYFNQMSEKFNQDVSLSGKIASGLFYAMFDFRGFWQKDASSVKSLAYDGWFISLYNIELERSHMTLSDQIKQEVRTSWDATALADYMLNAIDEQAVSWDLHRGLTISIRPPIITPIKNEDILSISIRRGGVDMGQSHNQWLSTVSQSPNIISMSFVPITSLLSGVRGNGFLSHAVNLYLRYKPPIEELQQFLQFQIPRQWAPVYWDLPLTLKRRKKASPSLRFSFMGPKLYVNTRKVHTENRPVTGIHLYLEGKRSDHLAIHLSDCRYLQEVFKVPLVIHLTNDEKCMWRNYLSVEESIREAHEILLLVVLTSLELSFSRILSMLEGK